MSDIEKYLAIFEKKNKNERLSGKKETKEFQFWHEKISAMISIFKMIQFSEKAALKIVDPDCIFKNEEKDEIKTILETKRQIAETRKTRIKQVFKTGDRT